MPVDEIMMIIFVAIYGMIRHLYCQILTNNAIPKILHNVYIEDRLSRFISLRILSFFLDLLTWLLNHNVQCSWIPNTSCQMQFG